MSKYIEVNPKVAFGKPVIKGTRLTVQFVLDLLAEGLSIEDIVKEYPRLNREKILAVLDFAQKQLDDITYLPIEHIQVNG